jgi:hypothetical protein
MMDGYSEIPVNDPLANLVERAALNPGEPFKPEVLDALAELKAEDRAAYEELRAALKSAKVRVTQLDQAINQAAGTETERQTQADMLLDLAASAELFHTGDKTAYADISISDHRETWPVRSKGFRRWLGRAFYIAHHGAPNSEALQSAIAVIEAKAHYDAPERAIYLRVGEHGGNLYIDLADETWRAIEIDQAGWRIVADPPVRFRRAAGMLPLPEPVSGGSLDQLRALLNVGNDEDFTLATAWLLATFRPSGPFPVLIVSGEQGSAKSTFVRLLRSMIDPNAAAQRSLPREDRDLFIAANNGHVLSFDNVSGLPAWISDTLCRLSTGGGFAARTLYTDSDEILFDAMRPIALNGIEDVVSRPDLAERGLFITLTAIPETARRTESEINAAIDAARPAILGALLDAVMTGLKRLPTTKLERMPRMADFALWATACGDGTLWPDRGFMAAHDSNRAGAVNDAIETDPVASAIRGLMDAERAESRALWAGTAQNLLAALKPIAGDTVTKSKTWPETPRVLSGRVMRAATVLRAIGIEVIHRKSGDRKFFLADKRGDFAPVAPVAPEMADFCGFSPGAKSGDRAQTPSDGRKPGAKSGARGDDRAQTPSEKWQSTAGLGDAGAKGAKIPTQSGAEKTHNAGGWI